MCSRSRADLCSAVLTRIPLSSLSSASRLRLLPGFLETRQKLLTMKPTNRMHW